MNSCQKLAGLRGFSAALSSVLLPVYCVLCGRVVRPSGYWPAPLCVDCAGSLPVVRGPACPGCGRPLLSAQGQCIECRDAGPALPRVQACYHYTGQLGRLLAAYKKTGRQSLAVFLAARLDAVLADWPGPFRLVPVPPRPGKLRGTGWDQVDRLVRILRRRYGYSLYPCLRRRRGGQQQKRLNAAARARNMAGRFYLYRPPPPEAIILVDDVLTTGATLRSCAHSLEAGGARLIGAVVLAVD